MRQLPCSWKFSVWGLGGFALLCRTACNSLGVWGWEAKSSSDEQRHRGCIFHNFALVPTDAVPLSAADLFLVFSYLITLESMHHTCQLPKEEELVQASIYFRQEQTLWTILDLEPPLSLEVKFHFPKAKPRNCSFGSCEATMHPTSNPLPAQTFPNPNSPPRTANSKYQSHFLKAGDSRRAEEAQNRLGLRLPTSPNAYCSRDT